MNEAQKQADYFVQHEREFHLGILPTEQANPKTAGLAEIMAADIPRGIRMLQSVDEDILPAAKCVFDSSEFAELTNSMTDALVKGRRICFSGCGATGRLSILLEAGWRNYWRVLKETMPSLTKDITAADEQVISIMTGGDYAVIRSVESFEDYLSFGRKQVIDAGLNKGDVLVAITEGGETSSVIGTVWQAVETGIKTFFICNNPLNILSKHIARSRGVIQDSRIIKIELASGPMAIAGSTRMQATTFELLVAGAALDMALYRYLEQKLSGTSYKALEKAFMRPEDYAAQCGRLLSDLSSPGTVKAMAGWIETEAELYRDKRAMTYFSDQYLLDIFTDTTERAPTFMLPPFRKSDDLVASRPWTFVKHPFCSTPETWARMLGRDSRCLNWNAETYRVLGAAEKIRQNPPKLDQQELFRFLIGNEDDPSRYSSSGDCAAMIVAGEEISALLSNSPIALGFQKCSLPFKQRLVLSVGPAEKSVDLDIRRIHIPCDLPFSLLGLWNHLAVKLVLNTVSTAVMARLGRVISNWMVHVETTNKKLIDRGTRLVAELCGIKYAEACYELHKTRLELSKRATQIGMEQPSPVALTIARLRKQKGNKI